MSDDYAGVHTCHANCTRWCCLLRKENARFDKALAKLTRNRERVKLIIEERDRLHEENERIKSVVIKARKAIQRGVDECDINDNATYLFLALHALKAIGIGSAG